MEDENTAALAEKFEITGGDIDVQVRQVILRRVLNKKIDLFNSLVESCSNEYGFSSKRRLGFNP